jgi:hypothetical protein
MSRVPYTILPSKSDPSKQVYKPLVNVRFNYKKTHNITPPVKALIDSGADVCFCADMIGAWLGIKFDKLRNFEEFTAANGEKFIAKPEIINIFVCNKEYSCKVYFTDVLPKNIPIILGQSGFFDYFKITFDLSNKMMDIV